MNADDTAVIADMGEGMRYDTLCIGCKCPASACECPMDEDEASRTLEALNAPQPTMAGDFPPDEGDQLTIGNYVYEFELPEFDGATYGDGRWVVFCPRRDYAICK